MSYHHVDRFQSAVRILAGEGNVKQRLTRAFQDNLDDIPDDDLPPSIKKRFAELRSRLTRVSPLNGEGRICASVRKMSESEAGQYAESVVALYDAMLRNGDFDAAFTPAEEPPEKAPPFLVKSAS